MQTRLLRVMARTDYNFSNLATGKTALVDLPLVQDIDVSNWRAGTLMVRIHAISLTAGSAVKLTAKCVAPTQEDPATFFRAGVVATVYVPDSAAAGNLFRGRLAANAGEAISLFLSVEKGAAGTIAFTISIDLLLQESDEWTPLELGSALRLWLDEHDIVTVASACSDWGDQSAAANDFTQGTATQRPGTAGTINSFNVPSFDGVNDLMKSGVLSSFISATSYHGFAVLQAATINGTAVTVYDNDGVICDGGIGWWGLFLKNNGGVAEVHAFHWDSVSRDATALGLSLGESALIEWSYDGSSLRCRVGAGTAVSVAASGSVGSVADIVNVGNRAAGATFFHGGIASIIVCNRALSTSEARNVRDFLSSKYGVPA